MPPEVKEKAGGDGGQGNELERFDWYNGRKLPMRWGSSLEKISIFQLVAPLVCLTFAATFVGIHLYNRNRIAPVFFALSYACGAVGLVLDIYRDIVSHFPITYVSNSFYMASAGFLVTAFAKQFRKPVPIREISIISALTLAIFTFFYEVHDSMTVRTILMNVSAGLMFGLALFTFPRKDMVLIDKLVFWVMVFTVAQFFVRTAAVFYVTGEPLVAETYSTSLFAKSFHFIVTLNSIILAIALCISMGVSAILDLQRLSQTDALTGLINRRGFEDEAHAAISKAQETGTPLSIIVCDIDHFKSVNDTYGHAFGDRVIRGFAKVLKERSRHSDLVGRIGGEEFCILLPNANSDMAKLVAGACRVAFANRQFEKVPPQTRFTASFGIAELTADDRYSCLFRRADGALYSAKKNGRNRVDVESPDHHLVDLEPDEQSDTALTTQRFEKKYGMQARRSG